MSRRFEGERAVVVGAGVAGASAARVLADEGAQVRVTETRSEADLGPIVDDLRRAGVEVLAGGHRPSHLHDATLVVTGPGVPPSADILTWVRERGLPLWGELELGARLATAPYVAVTGTNGKTTTTAMVESCARAAGLDAVACGNIGRPFPEAAREDHDVLVVEASSFQLTEQTSFHPRVSVLLNLAPDHLDWHGSFTAYAEAKARIFALQGSGDVHIGNLDDEDAAAMSRRAPCRIGWFTLDGLPEDGPAAAYGGDGLTGRAAGIVDLGNPASDGPAIRADAAACAAACLAFGLASGAIREGLAGFRPARHRGEEVAVVDGVRFIDNSKATNVHAALAAIEGVEDAVLVAGGRAKGIDLSPLAQTASRLRAVVAIGEAAPQVVEVFDGRVPVSAAASIEDAVREAFVRARPAGIVLLAPACASWDQFTDYAERGDRFAAAARALGEVGVRG
jgi:UDP-N-acetylmuramoylalanine--D-glutamate ligase